MRARVSRFERRIILAILLCALTPFVISLIFIPQIIESRLALSMHSSVREQLESAAVFFKEFFDAKKAEFSARAETIAKDPVLIRAARAGAAEDIEMRFEQILADHVALRGIRIFTHEGVLLAEKKGPAERQSDGFVAKNFALPLGLGDAPRIEMEFILPKRYLEERAHAEEIAILYGASFETEEQRFSSFYLGYMLILAVVVLGALSAGFYLARGVTSRIARIAGATERVARGESGFEIPVGGSDEITELTRGFNKMIAEVAEARDRIVYLEKVSGWQEFARRLAHEIKNPLTPIRLAIQELRRRAPENEPRFKKLVDDATDVIEEEIGALTRLVDEFSQFARLPEVTTTPLEIRRFLSTFLDAYNHFEPDADVTLELCPAPAVAAIDRVLMRRVLANLVENAIHAARPARARITLRVATIPASGVVEIRVEDNGPGIPLDDIEKIFEPYFTTKADGTGLGLAIVKKIVLQHQGAIAVRRSPSGGAAMVITLPPASGGAEEDDGEIDPQPGEPPEGKDRATLPS